MVGVEEAPLRSLVPGQRLVLAGAVDVGSTHPSRAVIFDNEAIAVIEEPRRAGRAGRAGRTGSSLLRCSKVVRPAQNQRPVLSTQSRITPKISFRLRTPPAHRNICSSLTQCIQSVSVLSRTFESKSTSLNTVSDKSNSMNHPGLSSVSIRTPCPCSQSPLQSD